MPIIYRDTSNSQARATPAHLVGAADLQRVESSDGDIVGIWNPMLFAVPARPPWKRIAADWEACQVGDLALAPLLRTTADVPAVLPVSDSRGRIWHVPVIMRPEDFKRPSELGVVALSLAWGVTDGVWQRVASAAQQRLIDAARGARKEILAGNLMAAPMDALASWTTAMIEATYHLSAAVIGTLGLIDDRLVVETLVAANGWLRAQQAPEPVGA